MIKYAFILLITCYCHKVLSTNTTGHRSGYIIGGKTVPITQYPFIVSFRRQGMHFCGGSIVSRRWILTAAHCLNHISYLNKCVPSLKIIAGSSNCESYKSDKNSQAIRGKKCILHKNYVSGSEQNDIGMVYLRSPLRYTKYVQQAPIPSMKNSRIDLSEKYDECTAIGWGRTSVKYDDYGSNFLKSVELPLISHSSCRQKWRRYSRTEIKETQVCTFSNLYEKGAYKGDSGSPLICGENQVGITSFTAEPDIAMLPIVFTRVDKYIKWIKKTMKSGSPTYYKSLYFTLLLNINKTIFLQYL